MPFNLNCTVNVGCSKFSKKNRHLHYLIPGRFDHQSENYLAPPDLQYIELPGFKSNRGNDFCKLFRQFVLLFYILCICVYLNDIKAYKTI